MVEIRPIDTKDQLKDQLANQFAKGLQVDTFEYLRYKHLGW